MNNDDIIKKINNENISLIGIKNEYSVVILFVEKDNASFILLEKRSAKLITQPGEVSFPGGKIEKNENSADAAFRELYEETGIRKEKINFITEGDIFISPFNLIIYSYLGFTDYKNIDLKVRNEEVEELFLVPVKFFIKNKPEVHVVNMYTKTNSFFPHEFIPDGENYKWRDAQYPVYFYKYEDKIIWGLTAKFIFEAVKKINKK